MVHGKSSLYIKNFFLTKTAKFKMIGNIQGSLFEDGIPWDGQIYRHTLSDFANWNCKLQVPFINE